MVPLAMVGTSKVSGAELFVCLAVDERVRRFPSRMAVMLAAPPLRAELVTLWPIDKPAVLATMMVLELLVRLAVTTPDWPLMLLPKEMALLVRSAVAPLERVMVVLVGTAAMVVPARMPGPET